MDRKNLGFVPHLLPVSVLAAAMLLSTGCKQSAPASQMAQQPTPQPAQQPVPVNDGQITTQVQSQIASENALKGLPIQVQSVNGIVTLSGRVDNDAARELAANDAAQISGVKTVVNNLVVGPTRRTAASASPVQPPAPVRRFHRAQAQQQQFAENNVPPPPPPTLPTDNSMSQAQPAPPPAVAPPPPPQPVQEVLTIPAGTDLPVRITETLDSGKTQSNTPFHGVLSTDLIVNGVVAVPQGSNVLGRVIEAKDATHFKGSSELTMELTQLTAHKTHISLVTNTLAREGQARGKNTAEKAGGGALLGTLIGALAGGGKGALIGALAGGGAGTAANTITRGQQVNIPSESILHFSLKDPIQVTVLVPPGNQGGQPY